jgi:hypothetical protein
MMHTADRTYLPGNTPQQRAAVVAEREEGVVGCLELVGAIAQRLDGHPLAAARHNVLMALLVHSHSTSIAAEVALFAKAPARASITLHYSRGTVQNGPLLPLWGRTERPARVYVADIPDKVIAMRAERRLAKVIRLKLVLVDDMNLRFRKPLSFSKQRRAHGKEIAVLRSDPVRVHNAGGGLAAAHGAGC